MRHMHKVGVVGDKDSILAFKALGVDVYPVVTKEEARKRIDSLANEKLVEETVERYNKELTPAIILIPNNQGSLGIGLSKIDEYVEKAIGSNIF